MRKVPIGIHFLCLMIIFLCACAAPESGETAVGESGFGVSEEQPRYVGQEGGVGNPLAPYQRIVEENAGMSFSLIDLDGDEIFELVVTDNESYAIYTIRDGEVLCLVDLFYTVDFTYFEGKGIITGFDRWNGGGDEGGYGWSCYLVSAEQTMVGGNDAILEITYNAIYDEAGEYTGEGVTEYFYMGRETDEETYREAMKAMGIAEDDDLVLDVVSAEKILEAIK